MAKTKAEETVAVAKVPEVTALATMPDDLIANAGRGTEAIGADDVRPPRILICQAGSPQRKPDDPKQIIGLNELDLFNSLSGEIYGRGPLKMVVITSLGSRHIEFNPMEEGGGVKDFNVAANDPRTQFTDAEDGTRVKPVATKFYDFLVWLPDTSEIVALSMKSTQLKVAIKLNGLIKMPLKIGGNTLTNPPAWARTFELTTAMEKRDNHSWGNFGLRAIGITETETRQICASLADVYQSKNVVIDVDDTDHEEAADDFSDSKE